MRLVTIQHDKRKIITNPPPIINIEDSQKPQSSTFLLAGPGGEIAGFDMLPDFVHKSLVEAEVVDCCQYWSEHFADVEEVAD